MEMKTGEDRRECQGLFSFYVVSVKIIIMPELEKEKDNAELDNIVVRPEGEGSILRTDKLVKRYGKRTVANGVSINVKQGEIVGLLGPNGAGKLRRFI